MPMWMVVWLLGDEKLPAICAFHFAPPPGSAASPETGLAGEKRFKPLRTALAAAWMIMSVAAYGYAAEVPALTFEERQAARRLKEDVTALAEGIGERTTENHKQLEEAARLTADRFADLGYRVRKEGFEADGREVVNVEAEIVGKRSPEEIVVIGAHYDSPPGSPGANDNGSGVAALLELARVFSGASPDRTLRFVAFANEEPPWFQTRLMGSRVYAQAAKRRGEKIVGMISLETIGYYSEEEGSQHYPPPLGLFYPGKGNFLGFVGNWSSRSLLDAAIASFKAAAAFPVQRLAAPEFVPGVGWSDHWSFWKEGYPAIMVTDTAHFRYPHYHQATDMPDKVDYERLARVTTGMGKVVQDLLREEKKKLPSK